MQHNTYISEEQLKAYAAGQLYGQEKKNIEEYLSTNPAENEVVEGFRNYLKQGGSLPKWNWKMRKQRWRLDYKLFVHEAEKRMSQKWEQVKKSIKFPDISPLFAQNKLYPVLGMIVVFIGIGYFMFHELNEKNDVLTGKPIVPRVVNLPPVVDSSCNTEVATTTDNLTQKGGTTLPKTEVVENDTIKQEPVIVLNPPIVPKDTTFPQPTTPVPDASVAVNPPPVPVEPTIPEQKKLKGVAVKKEKQAPAGRK